MGDTAREYWTEAAGQARVREVPRPTPGDGEVLIATEVSGISAGTESLVHRGEVPDHVAGLMRAPLQLGDLPFPVSHGYLNVGVVEQGPQEWLGQRVFTLGGHRSHLIAPVEMCHRVPQDLPSDRALLAGLAEVALNAVWESQISLQERVGVVGGGVVGLLTALLADQVSPQRLEVIEIDPERRAVARQLGLTAVSPEQAQGDNDVVFHTSAQAAGLATSLEITGDDGAVIEMSWYGTAQPSTPLGADFHARRLRLIGSQVGAVASPKRQRRTRADRLAAALRLLSDRFDPLITGRTAVEDLPELMNAIASGQPWTRKLMLHVITY